VYNTTSPQLIASAVCFVYCY